MVSLRIGRRGRASRNERLCLRVHFGALARLLRQRRWLRRWLGWVEGGSVFRHKAQTKAVPHFPEVGVRREAGVAQRGELKLWRRIGILFGLFSGRRRLLLDVRARCFCFVGSSRGFILPLVCLLLAGGVGVALFHLHGLGVLFRPGTLFSFISLLLSRLLLLFALLCCLRRFLHRRHGLPAHFLLRELLNQLPTALVVFALAKKIFKLHRDVAQVVGVDQRTAVTLAEAVEVRPAQVLLIERYDDFVLRFAHDSTSEPEGHVVAHA